MYRILNAIKPLLLVAVAALMAHCNVGCQQVAKVAGDPNAEYALETARCVNNAQTLQESRECRAKVNWKWELCPAEDIPC